MIEQEREEMLQHRATGFKSIVGWPTHYVVKSIADLPI